MNEAIAQTRKEFLAKHGKTPPRTGFLAKDVHGKAKVSQQEWSKPRRPRPRQRGFFTTPDIELEQVAAPWFRHESRVPDDRSLHVWISERLEKSSAMSNGGE